MIFVKLLYKVDHYRKTEMNLIEILNEGQLKTSIFMQLYESLLFCILKIISNNKIHDIAKL